MAKNTTSGTKTTSTTSGSPYIGYKLGDKLQASTDGGATWQQRSVITSTDDGATALTMCQQPNKLGRLYRIVDAASGAVKVHSSHGPEAGGTAVPTASSEPTLPTVDEAVELTKDLDHSAEFMGPQTTTPAPGKKTKTPKATTTNEKETTMAKTKTPKATPPAKPAKGGNKGGTSGTAKSAAAKKVDPATERETAKEAGLTLVHHRILKALAKAGADGLSYREIEKETGYYSILTKELRPESTKGVAYPDSLGSKGYVREEKLEGQPLRFVITANGKKKIS